jgi:dTMP kinase
MLIVLEGPEAVGKSTQVRRLVDWLRGAGLDVLSLREPGGTDLGNEVRRLVLDTDWHLGARTEALLFMASRAELIGRVIGPALAAKQIVVLDRFFLSTYAYQIFGRGLPPDEVRAANRFATDGLVPDLTLLLTLPFAEAFDRLRRRSSGQDRIEKSSLDFHERVNAGFQVFGSAEWQRAHPECGHIVEIDATGSEDEVFGRLRVAVGHAWPGSFPANFRS